MKNVNSSGLYTNGLHKVFYEKRIPLKSSKDRPEKQKGRVLGKTALVQMSAFSRKSLRIETFLSRTVCVGGESFYLSLYGIRCSRVR
jgi:hypothetical protein